MRLQGVFFLAALLLGCGFESKASTAGVSNARFETKSKEENWKGEKWAVAPELSAIAYTDRTGAATSRLGIGASLELNAAHSILEVDSTPWFIGPKISARYLHPGASDGSFFGSGTASGGGSNMLLLPLDLKMGYALNDKVRVSVLGGGNLIYRSDASVSNLGSGSGSSSSLWKVYPNLGVDAEWRLTRNLGVVLHPDLTLTTGKNIYAASLSAVFIGY